MKYIFILAALLFPACASINGTGMGACRSLCQGQKVDSYKGETEECTCRRPISRATAGFQGE